MYVGKLTYIGGIRRVFGKTKNAGQRRGKFINFIEENFCSLSPYSSRGLERVARALRFNEVVTGLNPVKGANKAEEPFFSAPL
jgi:hypothetical protein